MSIVRRLFATKNLEALNEQSEKSSLKRTLTATDLVLMGIGATIGSGIFVLTGTAAHNFAGPAIILSFVISGLAAATAALSYAELSSMIPISGSAYTYAYATMGELVAWIIGWDLILEYMIGAATVAVGWGGYTVNFFKHITGTKETSDTFKRFTDAALVFNTKTQAFEVNPLGGVNVPAIFITILTTILLIVGIKESARVNAVIVVIKVIVVLLFIFALIPKVDPSNWVPFIPPNEGTFGKFGVSGIFQGATTVFFAYIGFDAISTTAQEAKNPQRDLPIGIIGSLTICTVLYLAVCMVMTGVLSYTKLDGAYPLSKVVDSVGWTWLSIIVEIGAIAGLSSVILITLMGQPRIFYSMAEDGLFPNWATVVHPRFKTPWVSTILTGAFCAIAAGLLPIDVLGEMTSIGTLFAFFLVNIGVIILRVKRPDAPRKFKVPLGAWVIPLFGAICSAGLVATATLASITRLAIWMALGLVIYFGYGYRNSKLGHPEQKPSESGNPEDYANTA